ncbi:MAG: FtsW/RodA/SpoVE family cell cycle protein [Lachnospiraceae bacterium]|nr:FtsW/RodA/SpoVE family cell cycle protein [Lachnospiraceae bacterium]
MADKKRRKKEQAEYFFDYSLLFVVLFLLGFGLIMIYSVSSYEAQADYGDEAYYLKKKLLSSIIGVVAMIFVANIPYPIWRRFAGLGYIVAAVLIVMVPFFGVESHGAKRWLPIPGIGLTIQPAEVAKLCMILFLANLVCKMGKSIQKLRGMFFLMVTAIPMVLLVWQLTDNLSSAIIILGISVFMIFVASPDYKGFIAIGVAGVAAVTGLVYYISQMQMSEDMGFRFKRILTWLNPEAYADSTGFQTIQALYAIGSGGILGKGLGQSMQKLGFIPEAQNDMIFSIICEELGLFGAVLIIFMFILLLWRMMVIATNAPDLFGSLLVVGVMGHIAIQVILNIAVVTNTIPNTGISLPFISYGGTSVLFLLIEIGLVLNVARRIQLKEV